ncbi:MAG TPA: PHB depolymerase family esterase [Allosphingosinicella sp.]|jgi:poly(hydroxyalkanoate) depolymerase family esterase
MPVITPRLRLRRSRKGVSAFAPKGAARDRLSDLDGVRDNPGNLLARCYVPEGLAPGAPLVVVLHGCTQNAAVYDHGSGWSTLADRHGFALLYPEQQRANNPMLCFNWFERGDTARGKGEAASIASMVDAMVERHGVDRARVFVTGLSAGGAMSSVMLATYPDLFAGGAIIAGVAYGGADSVGDAFEWMAGRGRGDGASLARIVRAASRHDGPWPRIQVWHGAADSTVVPANAEAIAAQWAALHGVGPAPDRTDTVSGFPRKVWTDAAGEPVIEHYSITGMAHGVPLAASEGEDALGAAGAHMLEVGLSSTAVIADFFGIAGAERARGVARPAKEAAAARPAKEARTAASGPQAVIEKALRAAGLMR